MLMKALPELAPPGLSIAEAPSFREFPLYDADIQGATGFPAAVTALADAIRAADGVVFCTPEYNFSLPGGLKNAIDWVSRLPNQPFAGKPIAIQSASPGPLGGARVQYDLRRAMVFLDALTLNKPEIFVGGCAQKFDEKTGTLTDATTRDFVKQQLAAFARFIERHGAKT
jgi:chromate reductase